ncbi:ArsR/SmtB family transcription factor [Arthrobacter sp. NPDC090010]|uniref:ArsR/SmtB family transcription factor n=1 Tax=Arthrobacter sp. NPDC090010 TaxID=3363942 RepID=UPI00382F9830
MLPDVFGALANPTRRHMLDSLRGSPRTAGELTATLNLSRSTASEHLSILRQAGLVLEERQGRHRVYRLQAEGLAEVSAWLKRYEQYWEERLDALGELLDASDPAPEQGEHP